jgi:GTPase SAR1 family protein
MESKQILPEAPKYVQFRVLIIGRANAGKTSILQRVCDTTESPEIYCVDESGARSRVRFVLSGTFDLIFYLGSTRSFDRG